MNGHVRLCDGLGDGMLRLALYRPWRFAVALGAFMAVRALAGALSLALFGVALPPMFADAGDRFADLVKVAMSYRFITDPAVHSGAFHAWSPLFQRFMLSDDYVNTLSNLVDPHAIHPSLFHLSPMASLIYMGCARALVMVGPGAVLGGFVLVYGAGALALARGMGRDLGWFVLVMACLSYPALFMLDRANCAGLVALLDMAYLWTLRRGRHRWLGWLALALAVNLRPEPALLALMEVLGPGTAMQRFARMVIPGVASIALMVASFAAAHAIWPDYTLEHMRQGLALYDRLYVVGYGGDDWNVAIRALTKGLAQGLRMPALMAALLGGGVAALGLGLLALGLVRAMAGGLDWHRWLFLLCAIPTLTMPVHAYYHMVRFVPVVVWLVHDMTVRAPVRGDHRLVLLGLAGLAMSPLGGAQTQGLLAALLVLVGCDVALFARRGEVSRFDTSLTMGA